VGTSGRGELEKKVKEGDYRENILYSCMKIEQVFKIDHESP
jgi:hypothetical protein